jgi:hypothetical protein
MLLALPVLMLSHKSSTVAAMMKVMGGLGLPAPITSLICNSLPLFLSAFASHTHSHAFHFALPFFAAIALVTDRDTGDINVTAGSYSVTGPRCMIKQMDGLREGRCIDGDSGNTQPGGETQVYPCVHRWLQFFSFGNGQVAPKGSIFFTIPMHIVQQIRRSGHEHIPYMCLGVWGRGSSDEVEWESVSNGAVDVESSLDRTDNDDDEESDTEDEEEHEIEDEEEEDTDGGFVSQVQSERGSLTISQLSGSASLHPLSEWIDAQIYSTQCSNDGGVIEWMFVPYIVEDEGNPPLIGAASTATAKTADALSATAATALTPSSAVVDENSTKIESKSVGIEQTDSSTMVTCESAECSITASSTFDKSAISHKLSDGINKDSIAFPECTEDSSIP